MKSQDTTISHIDTAAASTDAMPSLDARRARPRHSVHGCLMLAILVAIVAFTLACFAFAG